MNVRQPPGVPLVSGVAAVAAYLLARDISRFNPKAEPPMTKAKQAMIDLARPEHERWLEEQFAEGGAFAGFSIMTTAEITSDRDAPHGLTSNNVRTALRAAGFQAGPEIKLKGRATAVWLRKGAIAAKGSPETLRKRYAEFETSR